MPVLGQKVIYVHVLSSDPLKPLCWWLNKRLKKKGTKYSRVLYEIKSAKSLSKCKEYLSKCQELLSKCQEYLNKCQEYLNKSQEYLSKCQDYLSRSQE